jgi:hypothetical protein
MNESYAERGYAERGYAKRGYARGGGQRSTTDEKSTSVGGVILAAVSLLCTVLVLLGLVYATGTGERHKVALAAGGCEPNLLSVNVGCTTVFMLEGQWTRITTSAVQQLNADVADYTVAERRSLPAAKLALTAELTTAKAFDKSLAQFPFSPFVAPSAKTLMQAIQARVTLTAEQVRSTSLAQLRSFNARIDASGAKIQTDMDLVHKALFTPPTAAQEP